MNKIILPILLSLVAVSAQAETADCQFVTESKADVKFQIAVKPTLKAGERNSGSAVVEGHTVSLEVMNLSEIYYTLKAEKNGLYAQTSSSKEDSIAIVFKLEQKPDSNAVVCMIKK